MILCGMVCGVWYGEYQNFKQKGGAYTRENFFNKFPETAKLVENLSDNDIWKLNRGGHDPVKVMQLIKKQMRQKEDLL